MRNDVKKAMADGERATTEPPPPALLERLELDSKELAWAAETADGTRDKTMFLVLDQDGALQLKESMEGSDRLLRRVKTASHVPARRKVLEVSCAVDGWNDPARLSSAEKWDAVFWTESSIEKFLYPYYHCQRLWDERMDSVRDAFEHDAEAVAIAHRAPSNSKVLGPSPVDTLGVARLTTRDGVPRLEWLSGSAYLVVRGHQ
ncbi:MAG TPA: hypothetical protein VFG66_09655 [Gemmatimonadales bacterium]|jgi:hypothetical protein|nr:hypothetical protein [Gemmatimonadales bacterium]